MAKPPRQGAIYPDLRIGEDALVVERLRREDVNMDIARAVQTVMQPAYVAQFEWPRGSLPTGVITEGLFNPASKKKVRSHHGRMSSHMSTMGSQYWLLRDPEAPTDLIGLSKVTPEGKKNPTPYFNDVSVRPDRQRHGYGTVLAHAALKFGPLSPDGPLQLAGFGGSTVNAWYEEVWGLTAAGMDPEGFPVNDRHTLPQVIYTTPEGLTVGGIIQRLEERTPELVSGHATLL
jgi:hypothetical protein